MTDTIPTIDALIEKTLECWPLFSAYIETSISEETPSFLGFPAYFKYLPTISIHLDGETHVYSEPVNYEHPDHELVRCKIKCRALELGLQIAQKLQNPKTSIKVNDLPLEIAVQQFAVYKTELQRIEEEHKNSRWM